MSDEPTFTVEEAVRTQRELRAALGLGPETFPLAAFVGMISDEIQQMRESGRGDLAVSDIVARVTGRRIEVADLQRLYAPPDARRRSEQP